MQASTSSEAVAQHRNLRQVLVVIAAMVAAFVIGTLVGNVVGSGPRTAATSGIRSEVVAEHGPFTSLIIRDRVPEGATRTVGADGGFDPDIVAEHGPFTSLIIRDPISSDATPRFAGDDAALD